MSISLSVHFYVQDLLHIDVNMVAKFQQFRNFTNKEKNKIVGICSI